MPHRPPDEIKHDAENRRHSAVWLGEQEAAGDGIDGIDGALTPAVRLIVDHNRYERHYEVSANTERQYQLNDDNGEPFTMIRHVMGLGRPDSGDMSVRLHVTPTNRYNAKHLQQEWEAALAEFRDGHYDGSLRADALAILAHAPAKVSP